jgi:hypothetical protein
VCGSVKWGRQSNRMIAVPYYKGTIVICMSEFLKSVTILKLIYEVGVICILMYHAYKLAEIPYKFHFITPKYSNTFKSTFSL